MTYVTLHVISFQSILMRAILLCLVKKFKFEVGKMLINLNILEQCQLPKLRCRFL